MRAGIIIAWLLAWNVEAASLQEVLSWMDRAATNFRSVQARVEKVTYTAVIDDRSAESGEMWLLKTGSRSISVKIEFEAPDRRVIAFQDGKAEIYYPKIQTVHVYDLGKEQRLVEQFLLLGFGTAGRDLVRQYQVVVRGNERIDGQPTERLELVPRDRRMRERLVKVELWIVAEQGYPVQQKFYWPSGDTTTVTYRAIRLNPPLQPSQLALSLPPNVKREYPQR